MRRLRVALGIRAQLLLVLTVFLTIPWLGYEYVRELERFLRDAQQRTLAGTAQAVATALHDRPGLFDAPAAARESLAAQRALEGAPEEEVVAARESGAPSEEIGQIIRGLSRTTARIWVIDRRLDVLARAGSLKRELPPDPPVAGGAVARAWAWLGRETLHPLYTLILRQPTDDFVDEMAARVAIPAREVDGALAGFLTTDRRPTADGKAVVVSAAHPIWVGDQVKGAVIVEETTNAVLAERNLAFERLFDIVLAALLLGSVAITLYASRLTARIRRLRDQAEAAIDLQGRVRAAVPPSAAGDEIGDLSRSFASVVARLSQYASYQHDMASRLSHELRTPIAVVRSSLDNLRYSPLPEEARVYMERAQQGLARLSDILTRMSEATRLEQSLNDVERERFDLSRVVAGCVDGYRAAYPGAALELALPRSPAFVDGAPELIAQMLDKLVANAVEFASPGTPVGIRVDAGDGVLRLSVENQGIPLPASMRDRVFDSMVSVRAVKTSDQPHLGLGLYIVRLIAGFHGGSVRAEDRSGGSGVIVTVTLPPAA
ncbi:MAG TPA: ATP-binding protein [Casimicrobiaceae bacterium]|nr:ATP-binding protein [Casimicrobiaceae bacterium]